MEGSRTSSMAGSRSCTPLPQGAWSGLQRAAGNHFDPHAAGGYRGARASCRGRSREVKRGGQRKQGGGTSVRRNPSDMSKAANTARGHSSRTHRNRSNAFKAVDTTRGHS